MNKFFFYCLMLVFILPIATRAERTSDNILSDIEYFPKNEKKQVQIKLHFQEVFSETPSLHYEPGWTRITLPHTKLDSNFSALKKINDGFINSIRLFQEGKSSTVEIDFRDLKFIAGEKIEFAQKKQILNVIIHKSIQQLTTKKTKLKKDDKEKTNLAKNEEKPEQNALLPQNNETKDTIPLNPEFEEESYAISIMKMLFSLLLVLALIYALLWIYNKFFSAKLNLKKGKYKIKVASTHHISPKQKIVVLEVNGDGYACGVTPSNISLISKIGPENEYKLLKYLGNNVNSSVIGSLRTEYQKTKSKTIEDVPDTAGKPKPLKSTDSKFGDELIKRVKQLRQID